MPITIENKTITVTTGRLTAMVEGPDLIELRNPQGKLLAGRGQKPLPALTLRSAACSSAKMGMRMGNCLLWTCKSMSHSACIVAHPSPGRQPAAHVIMRSTNA